MKPTVLLCAVPFLLPAATAAAVRDGGASSARGLIQTAAPEHGATRRSNELPGTPIGLLAAIERALEGSVPLRLAQTQVLLQAGVLREARGAFDPVLTQNTALSYELEELPNSGKESQRTTRNNIQDNIDDLNERIDGEAALLRELQAVLNDPTGAQVSIPEVRSQVELLNSLIAAERDPVIREELIALRTAQLNEAIADSQEELNRLIQNRDEEAERLRKLGAPSDADERYSADLSVGWRRAYRNGWALTASATMSMSGSNFRNKKRAVEFGGSGRLDLYQTKVGVDLFIPLQKGRTTLAAQEQAALFDLDAAAALLEQQAAAVIRDTATAYWALVAAAARRDIAADSLARQERIGRLTEALVQADEKPRADLTRVRATITDSMARLAQSEAALTAARLNLATVMGETVAELDRAPLPAEGFPPLAELPVLNGLDLAQLQQAALARRGDFRAAIARTESSSVLALAALAETQYRHDLTLSTSFSGVAEDSSVRTALKDAWLGNWTGPSASLTYGYERPWGNNAALGLAQQQEAQRQQAELAREDLERRLRSGVVQAFDRYTRALTQVRRAREAVVLYLGSVEDERERLAAGTTTLINLLLTEERATAALFAAVAAEQSYAAALLDLRFSTGLLLRREGERFVFRDRELMELSAEELTRW